MQNRLTAMFERWRKHSNNAAKDETNEVFEMTTEPNETNEASEAASDAVEQRANEVEPPADKTTSKAEAARPVAVDNSEKRTTTEPVKSPVVQRRRFSAPLIGLSAILVVVTSLAALAFAPGLRDTQIGVKIRFWEKPAPPALVVPPGQMAREMEQSQSENPSGAITIDPDMAEALGLQTAVVTTQDINQPVRTTGRVTPDERRITAVHTKVDGWIEEAFGNFEGQQINKGQKLFTIYSPDLVASQQEYLIALRARNDFKQSEFDVVQRSGSTLVESTRRRLQLWDVPPQQIAEIERTGKVFRALPFYAPASGVVIERKAFPGMRVMTDTELYKLADLSTIWVEADVFENDLMHLHVGLTGEVTLANNESYSGRVTYINPLIEPATRTAKVRLEFANRGLRLRPGMFVNVSLKTSMPPQIIVPRDSVIDTGMRQLVLIDNGSGKYTLREIKTGAQTADSYTVMEGLAVGEKVARNIQFLIDSETQLKQAVDKMTGLKAPAASGEGTMPNMPNMPGMPHDGGKR